MRRFWRWLGTLMIVAGVGTLAWAGLVWQWQDPATALMTALEQRGLDAELDRSFAAAGAQQVAIKPEDIATHAQQLKQGAKPGQAVGRLQIPRLGLDMAFVYGTDTESLKKGPGLDQRTFFPGMSKLVYIAGHRTTYGAPFSKIDHLRKGDEVTVKVPYGTFVYRVTGHRIVTANDLSVLNTKNFEQLALQACHPRFFATHRWITYGVLARASTPDGTEVPAASAAGP